MTPPAKDADRNDRYEITVKAGDNPADQLPVTVILTNVPEPQVKVTAIERKVWIREDVDITGYVFRFYVDDGPAGEEWEALLGGADAAVFRHHRTHPGLNHSLLYFRSPPDFENPTDAGGDNVYEVEMGARFPGNIEATPLAVTIVITDVEERPQFAVETAQHSIAEQTAANVVIGRPLTATDGDNDPLTYGLGGADARFFAIDVNGQLRTAAVLDYEAPQDQDRNNAYTVTVTVRDGPTGAPDDRVAVTIRVQNIDEAGSVALPPQPLVNVSYTALLSDPDGMTGVSWQWARSQTQGNWVDVAGATAATYTPVADDKDYYLRVSVTYTDSHGSKTLTAVSAHPVEKKDTNEPPEFEEGTAATRTVEENTPAGDPIGAPVTATDPDDSAESFGLRAEWFGRPLLRH